MTPTFCEVTLAPVTTDADPIDRGRSPAGATETGRTIAVFETTGRGDVETLGHIVIAAARALSTGARPCPTFDALVTPRDRLRNTSAALRRS